jgi:hypothetical protein
VQFCKTTTIIHGCALSLHERRQPVCTPPFNLLHNVWSTIHNQPLPAFSIWSFCTIKDTKYITPELCSQYTKPLTPNSQFSNLQFQLLHKSTICINTPTVAPLIRTQLVACISEIHSIFLLKRSKKILQKNCSLFKNGNPYLYKWYGIFKRLIFTLFAQNFCLCQHAAQITSTCSEQK